MATATASTVDWKPIWAQRGFRYFFVAMFVSLFGSGMNFAGVSWYIAWRGQLQLWHLYAMTLITGTGSAMYWATVNALVQEVIPPSQFTGANAAVLVGVQSGMLIAGSFVGFLYNSAGIAGILAIDGATYFVSAYCLPERASG